MAIQIQSIERAAAVLRLLTGHSRPRALAELAAELQLPKGTVYGILRTLQTVGFVEQDSESRRYQLGAALLHIGSSYLNGSELRRRALGCANALAAKAGESVRIGTLHENRVLIVHHVIGTDEPFPTLELGSLMPLHATALGKVLLAHHPHLAAEVGRGPLASYTTATLTDPDRLSSELTVISESGWAADVGEYLPGVGLDRRADQDSRRSGRRRDRGLRTGPAGLCRMARRPGSSATSWRAGAGSHVSLGVAHGERGDAASGDHQRDSSARMLSRRCAVPIGLWIQPGRTSPAGRLASSASSMCSRHRAIPQWRQIATASVARSPLSHM